MTQVCGFFVQATEYERGWGSRPDGYVIFASEEQATRFISEDIAGRTKNSVPDYYVDYTKAGWNPITAEEIKILSARGKVYRN